MVTDKTLGSSSALTVYGYDPTKLLLPGKLQRKFDLRLWLPRALFGAAAAVMAIGIVVSLQQWGSNRTATTAANKAITAANAGKPSAAPSTMRVTPSTLAAYQVAPDLPKYLIIPKLKVDARIYATGLTSNEAIGTPSNVHDTDWYSASSLPGKPGAMLIDGHVSSWTTQGVFYGIKNLLPGNLIQVVTGNNTTYAYKVVKSQVYSANNVDMTAVLNPVVATVPGLNLITCSGDVIAGTNTFSERVVVFAEAV